MANSFNRASVSEELALKMIDAAAKKATEIGCPMVIAVCDEGGNLKAYRRMDGAALLSVKIAQDKARTAVGFGMATHDWYDFIKDDPPLKTGIPGMEGLILFGGGYPIMDGDAMIGGLGVSGGHYTQDMECGDAALAQV